jgi:hypothetical protein
MFKSGIRDWSIQVEALSFLSGEKPAYDVLLVGDLRISGNIFATCYPDWQAVLNSFLKFNYSKRLSLVNPDANHERIFSKLIMAINRLAIACPRMRRDRRAPGIY